MTDLLPTGDLPAADAAEDDYREPTQAEIEAWERRHIFADDEWTTPDAFPRLWNVSTGFLKRAIVRPAVPEPPEYVTIVNPGRSLLTPDLLKRRRNDLLRDLKRLRARLAHPAPPGHTG